MFARLTYFLYAKRRMLAVLILALFLWAQAQPADAFLVALGILAVLGAGGGFALFKWGGGLIGDIATKALEAFVGILNTIAGATSALMQLLGQFFGFVLVNVNGSVSFYSNEFVRFGWDLVRDFANMGFVVFFLVAAIATILGLEQYGLKRLVPRIVIVALLVNFSLPLTALVVNFSQLLLQFFVIHLAQQSGYQDIANAIVNGMRVGEIVNISSETNLGSAAVSALFEIIFNLVAAATFLLLGVVFLLRIIALWVLMILSPLAIVAAVLPATHQHFQRWLSQFVHWSTFGIIAAFFMYLATALSFFVNSGQLFGSRSGGALEAGQGLASFFGAGEHIFAYITILVFLYMALAVARQGAGAMAQTVVATGGAMATGALGIGMGVAGRPLAARARRGFVESETAQRFAKRTGDILLKNRLFRRLPGAAPVGTQLTSFGLGESFRRDVEEEKKKARHLASEVLEARRRPNQPQAQKIADTELIADRADRPQVSRQFLEDTMNVAISNGDKPAINKVLSMNAQLIKQVMAMRVPGFEDFENKSPEQQIALAAKRYGGRGITAEASLDPNQVLHFEDRALNEIARHANTQVRMNITNVIKNIKPEEAEKYGVSREQLEYLVKKVESKPAFIQTIGGVPERPPAVLEEIEGAEETVRHEAEGNK